jgi:hypothetical protein
LKITSPLGRGGISANVIWGGNMRRGTNLEEKERKRKEKEIKGKKKRKYGKVKDKINAK